MGEVVHVRPGHPPERIVIPAPGQAQPPAEPPGQPPAAPQSPAAPETPAQPPAPAPSADPSEETDAAADETDEHDELTEDDGADDTVTVPEHHRRRPRRRDPEERIRRITAEKYELARERDAARAEVTALLRLVQSPPDAQRQATPPPAEPQRIQLPPRPREDDFESQAAFQQAIDRWDEDRIAAIAERRFQDELAKRDRQTMEQQQQTVIQSLGRRMAQGRQAFADFDLAIHDPSNVYRPDLIPVVNDVAAQHEQGHLLMYHLATHPEVREELDQRTPGGARRYLDALMQQLTAPPVAAAQQPRQPARNGTTPPVAPLQAPVTPLTTGSTPPPMDARSIAERRGSLSDYMKARAGGS